VTYPIDDRLASAGSHFEANTEVASALSALADARASAARSTRKRRVLIPSITIGVALAVSGAGAVVATQWQPWEITDPDIVVARDWADGAGTFLGSCETRLSAHSVGSDALEAIRNYLKTIDLDSMKPNPEIVAAELLSVGRPDDLSRLIPGAVASDYDVSHSGEPWSSDWFSDARILQDALMHEVFTQMSQEAYATEGSADGVAALANSGISAQLETQCTTDPSPSADK
jgi:hypothetical protein